MEQNDFHSIKVKSVTDGYQAECTCGWRSGVKDRMSDDYAYTNARDSGERHWRDVQRRRAVSAGAKPE